MTAKMNIAACLFLGLVYWAGAQDQPARQCNAAGSICSTCNTVAVCVATGDGGFETLVQPCGATESCVAGQCIEGALCNYRPFQCNSEGYYPDPYDCRRYHICLPAEGGTVSANSFMCPDLTAYNASSQDCSSTVCLDRPVPECTQKLQIGAVPNDENLYYVCIERDNTIAPELRRCPGGRVFDVNTTSCVDPTGNEKTDKKKKKKSKGD